MEYREFKGIDEICFGDDRSVVRGLLGAKFSEFKKSPSSETLTDAYDELGLHLYYDSDDRLEFVEGFHPAEICFRGISLIGAMAEDIAGELGKLGILGEEQDDSLFFWDHGFALIVCEEKVEGVSMFSRGYYD